jgi:hypothetical protein
MWRLFASIVGLFAVCAALTGMIHAASRRDPPARVAALLPDPECPAPCWQGLRPGYASARDLQTWIESPPRGWTLKRLEDGTPSDGSLQSWSISGSASLTLTVLQSPQPTNDQLMIDPPALTLGDLIAAHGAPDYFDVYMDPPLRVVVRLYYPADRLIALLLLPAGDHFLWPSQHIDSLIYSAVPWARPLVALDWRGPFRLTIYR